MIEIMATNLPSKQQMCVPSVRGDAAGRRGQDAGGPGGLGDGDLPLLHRGERGDNPQCVYSASSVTVSPQAKISTIDMLHHIEMRMETLTQQLEALNPAKVNITYLYIYSIYTYLHLLYLHTYSLYIYTSTQVEVARVSCEVERRAREKEARLERQRSMEATRNKAALDRALAPPYRWPQSFQRIFAKFHSSRRRPLLAY